MSDNVISLSERRPPEPRDDRVMCEIIVTADGETTLWLSDVFETPEQFNWLLAKLASVGGTLIDTKIERTKQL